MNFSQTICQIVSVIFLLSSLVEIGSTRAEERQPLKVGLIVPLTGPGAEFGIACKNGLEMALSELPAGSIDLVVEDDEMTSRKTVAAFKKLTTIDKVDLVMGISSSTSNAIAPIAEAAKIPLIAWANDPKVGYGRQYVVLSERSAVDEGEIAARETRRRGYPKVALVRVTGDYPEAFSEGMSKELGAHLALHEEVPPDTIDFRSLAAKVKARGAASIGLCLNPGQFEAFYKAASDLGFHPAYFGCHAIEGSIGAFDSAWYTTIEVSKEFRDRYRKRFGNEKVLSGAAIHYETGRLLGVLLQQPSIPSSQTIPDVLMALQPASGSLGKFSVVRRDEITFFDIPISIRNAKIGGN